MHIAHTPMPAALLNVPASHMVHTSPSDVPLYPGKHLQSSIVTLPDSELVPLGQIEHSAVLVPFLYSPVSHPVHGIPSEAAVYPCMHLQSVNSSLPAAELVPVGHVKHTPTPVATLYVPASHAVHSAPSEEPAYPTKHL